MADNDNTPSDFDQYLWDTWDQHTATVGRIAIRWNTLHEELGLIFVLLATRDNTSVGWAAWHSLRMDRAQRDMLEASAVAALGKGDARCKELVWALGQLTPLEDKRNTAIHSPYSIIIENGSLKTISNHFTGHGRATKLKDRDLEKELKSYEEHIDKLTDFVMALGPHFLPGQPPPSLPPRPTLPRPSHTATRKAPRPRSKNK